MSFIEAIKTCFVKYFDFKGRALRSEYWYFFLFLALVSLILGVIDGVLFYYYQIFSIIFSLAVLIPSISVAVRRLHDVGRSGWWILIYLTGIGIFFLLYWYIKKGDEGDNKYGPAPVTTTKEVSPKS